MSEYLRERIQARLHDLEPLPTVLQKLIALLRDPNAAPRELSQVIATDQRLSLQVLRMANSAYYAPPQPIATVQGAITRLGMNPVRWMAWSLAARDQVFAGDEQLRFQLWRHCLGTAVFARRLAEQIEPEMADELFLAGLLHDVGKLLLARHAPEVDRAVQELSRRDVDALVAEKGVFGATHADVGGWACEIWELPEMLVACVRHHHTPLEAGEWVRQASILHVADGTWHRISSEPSAAMSPRALLLVGLSMSDLERSASSVLEEFEELHRFLGMAP